MKCRKAASTSRSKEMLLDIHETVQDTVPGVKNSGWIGRAEYHQFFQQIQCGHHVRITCNPGMNSEKQGESHIAKSIMAEIKNEQPILKKRRILAIGPPAIPGLGATAGFTFELQQTTSTDNIQQFEAVST